MTLRRLLANAGLAVTRQATLDRLISNERLLFKNAAFPAFAKHIRTDFLERAVALLPYARAELFQDIFAALVLHDQEEGFFLEFGATDGVEGSNTWLFEKHLKWQGLLSEPARGWHNALHRNRTARISQKCVWRETGLQLEFTEAQDGGFSTLSSYRAKDRHADRRNFGATYSVPTISLNDLLKEHQAPDRIDFLSVDTEGSEFDILSAFDFSSWRILVACIEHNHRPDREDIRRLMILNGFENVLTEISGVDDWYVAGDLLRVVERVFKIGGPEG